MLTLDWVKSTADNWLSLENADLSGVEGGGVYIIWHAGSPPGVIQIGHGDIAAELGTHRKDLGILMYRTNGALYVTWAFVPADQRSGVVRYLADQYKPLIGDVYAQAELIPVNLVA
jgi:hypothetical protein